MGARGRRLRRRAGRLHAVAASCDPRRASLAPSRRPSGVRPASAVPEPPLQEQDAHEDARDDEELAPSASCDGGLDDGQDEQAAHDDGAEDLERESGVQADGGSGSGVVSEDFPRMRRSAQPMGSYIRVTTRSLSGMIALSVMWMPSGQTSVQHFVMLQKPSPYFSFARSTRALV